MAQETPLLIDHKTMPTPRTGYALVATGKGGPKVITDYRLSPSERLFGKYSFVEVHTGQNVFVDPVAFPSSHAGVNFSAEVSVTYRVTDALVAVKSAPRSVWEQIRSELYPKLREAARRPAPVKKDKAQSGRNDISAAKRSEASILDALAVAQANVDEACSRFQSSKPFAEFGIELRAVSATLGLTGEAEKLAEKISLSGLKRGLQREEQALENEARDHHEGILAGGPRKMIAEMMRLNPTSMMNLFDQFTAVEQNRHQNEIAIFKKLLDDGHLEAHQIPKEITNEFLAKVLNRAAVGDMMLLGAVTAKDTPQVEDKSASD